jgi:hypothetical protein
VEQPVQAVVEAFGDPLGVRALVLGIEQALKEAPQRVRQKTEDYYAEQELARRREQDPA